MSSRTGFFTDDIFLEHNTGRGHPENHLRLVSIRERLQTTGYFPRLRHLERRPASVEEIGLCHDTDYVRSVDRICSEQGGGYLDGDTIVSAKSYEAAVLSAGAGLAAADQILAGELERALLLLRPPGHHSLHDRAMGFCLFNNVAITARYLQKHGGEAYEKIAIVDWDVHHGNGTEAMFYDDPNVLFISTHQYPFYPGTGAEKDRGVGAGLGATLNLPMARGSGNSEYRRAFEDHILPALKEFQPGALLISAGFDAHKNDPLAGIDLESSSFEWMSHSLLEFAREHCAGRLISFLEGGYDLDALAESVEAHAAVLAG
ncbi:MAG: histone deacetylase [bacterium]|nr:histone deacetylase [bacterium]